MDTPIVTTEGALYEYKHFMEGLILRDGHRDGIVLMRASMYFIGKILYCPHHSPPPRTIIIVVRRGPHGGGEPNQHTAANITKELKYSHKMILDCLKEKNLLRGNF